MSTNPGILNPDEYERRRLFLEGLKSLTKAECIEVVRLLQKHNVSYSENANGIFFNVSLLTQEVFDVCVQFLQFTQSNRRDLAERELYMSSLATEMKLLSEKATYIHVRIQIQTQDRKAFCQKYRALEMHIDKNLSNFSSFHKIDLEENMPRDF